VDLDGDPVTYKLLKGPLGMTLDPKTGKLVWLATSKEIGKHTVTI